VHFIRDVSKWNICYMHSASIRKNRVRGGP
jgi:hypothetical protein